MNIEVLMLVHQTEKWETKKENAIIPEKMLERTMSHCHHQLATHPIADPPQKDMLRCSDATPEANL
jgi:hypothetical protein